MYKYVQCEVCTVHEVYTMGVMTTDPVSILSMCLRIGLSVIIMFEVLIHNTLRIYIDNTCCI